MKTRTNTIVPTINPLDRSKDVLKKQRAKKQPQPKKNANSQKVKNAHILDTFA